MILLFREEHLQIKTEIIIYYPFLNPNSLTKNKVT